MNRTKVTRLAFVIVLVTTTCPFLTAMPPAKNSPPKTFPS